MRTRTLLICSIPSCVLAPPLGRFPAPRPGREIDPPVRPGSHGWAQYPTPGPRNLIALPWVPCVGRGHSDASTDSDRRPANHGRLPISAHRPPRALQNDQGGLAGLEHARGHYSTGSSAWTRPGRTIKPPSATSARTVSASWRRFSARGRTYTTRRSKGRYCSPPHRQPSRRRNYATPSWNSR